MNTVEAYLNCSLAIASEQKRGGAEVGREVFIVCRHFRSTQTMRGGVDG